MGFVSEVYSHTLAISPNHSDRKMFLPSPRFPVRAPKTVFPLRSARHVHPSLFRFSALHNEISLDIRIGVPRRTILRNVADNFLFHYRERPSKFDRYNRPPAETPGDFLNPGIEKSAENEGAWEVGATVIQVE